jgi:Ca2+/Na+ antiporter
MELSTEIAFGIVKAIAIIVGIIIGIGFLAIILRAIPEFLNELIQGLSEALKWMLDKWKWLAAFVLVLSANLMLTGTKYEIVGSIVYFGFFLVCIGYYVYRKNERETKAKEWVKNQAEDEKTTANRPNLDPYANETFAEFLKRYKFFILFLMVFVVIANIL